MPLYEYRCEPCDDQFELLVRHDEKPVCPSCGRDSLEKLLSVPSAHTAGGQGQSLPMAPPGGFCGRGTCGMPGCGPE